MLYKYNFTKIALLLWMLLAIPFFLVAQTKLITGKVTDASDGYTIPGVNINIKNSTQGATTTIDGDYVISANLGDTLVFSFIGYNSEIRVVGSETVLT